MDHFWRSIFICWRLYGFLADSDVEAVFLRIESFSNILGVFFFVVFLSRDAAEMGEM